MYFSLYAMYIFLPQTTSARVGYIAYDFYNLLMGLFNNFIDLIYKKKVDIFIQFSYKYSSIYN